MKRAIALLILLMLSAVLVAGCTSNQDAELKKTIQESLTPMQGALQTVGRDSSNLDYAAVVQSGKALETESEIWYNRVSAINDLSPEWQTVKTNYLRALDYYQISGQKISAAGAAFQKGDLATSLAYTQEATANLESGSRYMDETLAAIPK